MSKINLALLKLNNSLKIINLIIIIKKQIKKFLSICKDQKIIMHANSEIKECWIVGEREVNHYLPDP